MRRKEDLVRDERVLIDRGRSGPQVAEAPVFGLAATKRLGARFSWADVPCVFAISLCKDVYIHLHTLQREF